MQLPHVGDQCKAAEACREDCMEVQDLSVVGCFPAFTGGRASGDELQDSPLPKNLSSNSFPKAINNR